MDFDATLKTIGALLDQLKADHEKSVSTLEQRVRQQQELLNQASSSLLGTSVESTDNPDTVGAPTDIVQLKETDVKVAISSNWEPLDSERRSTPNFVLREGWTKVVKVETFVQNVSQRLGNQSMQAMERRRKTQLGEHKLGHGDKETKRSAIARLLFIDPMSPYRLVWDLTGMGLIGYDMIGIPIQICFEPEPMWLTTGMGWITLVFWTLDMPASCCTGFFKEGELITSHAEIIKAYVSFWFWIDCIIVVPDWVMTALSGGGGSPVGLARMLRIARSLRILRLLRLLKLKKLFAIIYDLLDSEVMFLVFGLIQLVGIIMVLTHFVACIWHFVGRMSKDSGNYDKNWLEHVGLTPVYGEGLDWKYLTSLHWSITQFTPASMDVYAVNVPERLFSILILYIALVALSSFIGSISASVTQLRQLSAESNKNLWILRRYLKQKQISKALQLRILSYVDFQMVAKSNMLAQGQVKLLGQLSEQLKYEMQFEMTNKFIKDHPLFSYMNENRIASTSNENIIFVKTLHALCTSAFKVASVAEEETVFSLGDHGKDMFFVKSGGLEYVLPNEQTLEGTLKSKNWVAEGVLWTTWRHRGWLKSVEPSELLLLSPKVFADTMLSHPKPATLGQNYGRDFVNYLNRQEIKDLTDVIFDAEVWIKVVHESDQFVLTQAQEENPDIQDFTA